MGTYESEKGRVFPSYRQICFVVVSFVSSFDQISNTKSEQIWEAVVFEEKHISPGPHTFIQCTVAAAHRCRIHAALFVGWSPWSRYQSLDRPVAGNQPNRSSQQAVALSIQL